MSDKNEFKAKAAAVIDDLRLIDHEMFGEVIRYKVLNRSSLDSESLGNLNLIITQLKQIDEELLKCDNEEALTHFRERLSMLREKINNMLSKKSTAKLEPEILSKRIDGPTPNGGAYSIGYYFNDDDMAVDEKIATKIVIKEYTAASQIIKTTYGGYANPIPKSARYFRRETGGIGKLENNVKLYSLDKNGEWVPNQDGISMFYDGMDKYEEITEVEAIKIITALKASGRHS